MSRKIIILDRVNEPSDYDFQYVIRANSNSKIKDFYKNASILVDATQEEIDEVSSGVIVERSGIAHFGVATSLAEIKSELEKRLSEFQFELDNRNPWKLKGTSFDGTQWIDGGIS